MDRRNDNVSVLMGVRLRDYQLTILVTQGEIQIKNLFAKVITLFIK